MKIIIAPDSFKGSMSSIGVSKYIEEGFRKVYPEVEVDILPIADGGEGTVEALVEATKGRYINIEVTNPLGRKIKSKYGVINNEIAVIEMAAASGLTLIPEKDLNPLITTTYGTGEMIKDALEKGYKKIFVGLGGSATNDGGVGMAQALGFSFKGANGDEIDFGCENLDKITYIDSTNKHPLLETAEIIAISDVKNILCGPLGASYVYGPQKGATKDMVLTLDQKLSYFADTVKKDMGIDISEVPGAGAAGGLGAGLIAFCNARIESGVEVILDILDFDNIVKDVDLVITGEGRIDSQSKYGKVPVGVAKRSKLYNKLVIAVVGSREEKLSDIYDYGIDLIIDIVSRPMTLNEAMTNAKELLIDAGESVGRVMKIRGI